MKNTATCLFLVIGCFLAHLTIVMAGEHSDFSNHPDSADWDDLFQEDLGNAIVAEDAWTMEEGLLTAKEDKVLWSTKIYDNFILDLEFKFAADANSGVIVYASDLSGWPARSVEVQVADDYSEKWSSRPKAWQCGAIFGHKGATENKVVGQPGGWNRMTVKCKDFLVSVILNGRLINVFDMRAWTSAKTNPDGSGIPGHLSVPKSELPTYGHIGLQGRHGGADIFYRHVRVKELP